MVTLKRVLAAITPWWNTAPTEILRLDSWGAHYALESYGAVRRFEVQWLGLHLAFEIGATPPRLSEAEKQARRDYLNHLTKGA